MPDDLRERYAAIFRHAPGTERPGDKTPGEIADLILAVRDEELERLQKELAEWKWAHERTFHRLLDSEAERKD